ncbi:hypothetical protein GCM10023238_35830 [Streptomyces heliomycini]
MGRATDLVVARNVCSPAPLEEADVPAGGGPCPYPGMRPFLPEQRHLFFGREEPARELLDRVAHGDGPVVLVGRVRGGEVLALRAGLVAGLEERGTGPVLLVEGRARRPFRTLVERWARAVDRPFEEVEREVGAGRFGTGGPEVLVIDQLEELFTDCVDPEERELFVRAVSGAGAATGPRIVLGLRADFYGLCMRDARLARMLRAGQFTVPAMSDEELIAAIERPAEHAGLRLEDGLAGHLLHELRRKRPAAKPTPSRCRSSPRPPADLGPAPRHPAHLRRVRSGRRDPRLVARVADELYDARGAGGPRAAA